MVLCIVIPGLTRNPVLFQRFTQLDAGSVIPDLIRDRHDNQKAGVSCNGYKAFEKKDIWDLTWG